MTDTNMLDDHRKMFLLSGNLSDFQLKNLQQFPYVVFDNLKEATVDYDFGAQELNAGTVTYTLDLETDLDKDTMQTKCEHLSVFVRTLFWTETRVIIKRKEEDGPDPDRT